jgi:hypothetical protein
MCSNPLYIGLISDTYFSRNRRWRSLIMAGLLGRFSDGATTPEHTLKHD